MTLTSKTSYFVGYDFIIDMNNRQDYKNLQSYMDKNPQLKWMEDLRLPCISVVTHEDAMEHIYQYTAHYGKLIEKNLTIVNYIDFGFIPVAFYPTCYEESNTKIDMLLKSFGVNVHKFPALYAGDVRFRTAHTDTWVSRLEMSEILGIAPENVKTLDILRKVIQNEAVRA